MRLTEYENLACAEDRFPNMAVLRKLKDCTIWSAGCEEPLLLLVDDVSGRVAVFAYDSQEERERDAKLVRSLPEDGAGGDGAGVPAPLRPVPPTRVRGNAAYPVDDSRHGGEER